MTSESHSGDPTMSEKLQREYRNTWMGIKFNQYYLQFWNNLANVFDLLSSIVTVVIAGLGAYFQDYLWWTTFGIAILQVIREALSRVVDTDRNHRVILELNKVNRTFEDHHLRLSDESHKESQIADLLKEIKELKAELFDNEFKKNPPKYLWGLQKYFWGKAKKSLPKDD